MNLDYVGLVIVILSFISNFAFPAVYEKKGGASPDVRIKIKIASLIFAIIGMIIVFI